MKIMITHQLDKQDLVLLVADFLYYESDKYCDKSDAYFREDDDGFGGYVQDYVWNKKQPTKKEVLEHIRMKCYLNQRDDINPPTDLISASIYLVDKFNLK